MSRFRPTLLPMEHETEDVSPSAGTILGWLILPILVAFLAGIALSDGGDGASVQPATSPRPWPGEVSAREVPLTADTAPRALLISFLGARADFLETYLVDGTMRNLALLAANGVLPEYVIGVSPASPRVSHLSLATGSRPHQTGVVGEGLQQAVRSAAGRMASSAVPPIWEWDAEASASEAVLFWPGASADIGDDDIFLDIAPLGIGSSVIELSLEAVEDPASEWPASESPYYAGRTTLSDADGPELARILIAAIDSTSGGAPRYDKLACRLERGGETTPWLALDMGHAGELPIPGRPGASLTVLPLSLTETSGAMQARLYLAPAVQLLAQPAALEEEIPAQIGPAAAPPATDDIALGKLDAQTYRMLVERAFHWQADAALFIHAAYSPRILALCFDMLARVEASVPDEEDPYAPALRAAYRTADRAVGNLLAQTDMAETVVAAGTPHGYLPYHRVLNLDAILNEEGEEGRGAYAVFSNGGSAHIVIDLAGREVGGTIAPSHYEEYIARAVSLLDPLTQGDSPPLSHILTPEGLHELGLESPNSGDLFVQAAPGVRLAENDPTGAGRPEWEEEGIAFGYDPALPAMRGAFILAGPQVQPFGLIGPIHLVDIAPTIAAILDMEIPSSVEGRPLLELLSPFAQDSN